MRSPSITREPTVVSAGCYDRVADCPDTCVAVMGVDYLPANVLRTLRFGNRVHDYRALDCLPRDAFASGEESCE